MGRLGIAGPDRDNQGKGMWGFGLRQAGRLALGLLGAFLLAGAIAALPVAGQAGATAYFAGWWTHLESFAQLDFGTSQVTALPAAAELARRLPATLELVGAGALIALVLGVPLGLLLGTGQRMRAGAPLVQIVAAAPVFCAGLALLWLAAHVLGWPVGHHLGAAVSAQTAESGSAGLEGFLRSFALPALTVGAAGAAAVQLALRRAASVAMEAPYRRGLRLMGLGGFEIDRAYLVPEIGAGLLASLGEITLALFSATAVAEWVFGWPGAAVLFVKSIALEDWAVAALVLLVFAAIKLVADFAGAVSAHALARGEAAA
jgi:peptide/nickel transport system permease protein